MKMVNIFEAKTTLSKLIARVMAGEEIIIAKNNVPVAKLTSWTTPGGKREGNQWRGKVTLPDDFDREDEQIIALFEGIGR